jgi:hypothetical protein
MQSRQSQIRKLIQQLEKRIPIPSDLPHQAALDGEDERVLAIFDMPHADELFSQQALTLDPLYSAQTLEDMTLTIDNYLRVISFYGQHYNLFSRLISLPFFQDLLAKKGQFTCWNELMEHPFKKLNYTQSTTMVIDALTRMQSLSKVRTKVDDAVVSSISAQAEVDNTKVPAAGSAKQDTVVANRLRS